MNRSNVQALATLPCTRANIYFLLTISRAVFTHGPKGPERISRGGILKNIEIEVWYAGKKKAVHEREI
jgi:hypothetical protein